MNLNGIKHCFNSLVRSYHRNRKNSHRFSKKFPNPGIDKKLKMLKETTEINDLDNDFINPNDYSEFESDFMGAADSHKDHEMEVLKARERLKLQITRRKYIENEKEPSFLTFMEKLEVRNLHKKDPKYWTIYRLSECFPALPQTIKKVLSTEWLPRTVKVVKNYDKQVIENWEKFRSGQLPLNPIMEKHLKKYKDRKIIPANEEYIKQYILEPQIEFPMPKHNLFSAVIDNLFGQNKSEIKERQSIISNNADNDDTIIKNKSEIKSYKITNQNDLYNTYDVDIFKKCTENFTNKADTFSVKNIVNDNVTDNKNLRNSMFNEEIKSISRVKRQCNEPQSFSEFIKKSVMTNERNTQEAIVMEDIFQKQLEKEKEKSELKLMKNNSDYEVLSHEKQCNSIEDHEERQKEVIKLEITNQEKDSLHTYVKKWIKLNEDEHYPMCIRIPKSRYIKGMTYRIKDCYYDDDGQFLYRVPGLKS